MSYFLMSTFCPFLNFQLNMKLKVSKTWKERVWNFLSFRLNFLNELKFWFYQFIIKCFFHSTFDVNFWKWVWVYFRSDYFRYDNVLNLCDNCMTFLLCHFACLSAHVPYKLSLVYNYDDVVFCPDNKVSKWSHVRMIYQIYYFW